MHKPVATIELPKALATESIFILPVMDPLTVWDNEFINIEDTSILFQVILAANHLDIKPLLELGYYYYAFFKINYC